VGWGLERRGGGRPAKTVWYHRETRRTAHGKAHLLKVDAPGDVSFPAFFASHDYKIHDLAVCADGDRTRATIPLRYNRTLVLELKTEDRIRLYCRLEEGADSLLLHRAEFDEIYFAFDVRAWLSPDGRRVALAIALDGDIRLDAALVVLVLPVAGWQHSQPAPAPPHPSREPATRTPARRHLHRTIPAGSPRPGPFPNSAFRRYQYTMNHTSGGARWARGSR